ncbi:DUF4190 domain-containing protein [Demequina silvatica]|uniref:DUF4190 domain-containing protein n=1 Tax=Demequina silvatica TaxID=1638988 RepID=UPI0007807709|nr:DUF4190 domain-containing protein [Demequina silvatica]
MSTPQEPFDPAAPRPVPPYAQAPQPAPQQYAQQPYAPQRVAGTEKNWMGVTALVLSLAGLFTGITAIAGIVFGHLSLGAVKRGEADNRGVGLAGLIIGYVITVLGILVLIGLFAAFGWLAFECGGDSPADWCTSTGS